MAHSILTECSSRQYKDVLVHTLNSYFLFLNSPHAMLCVCVKFTSWVQKGKLQDLQWQPTKEQEAILQELQQANQWKEPKHHSRTRRNRHKRVQQKPRRKQEVPLPKQHLQRATREEHPLSTRGQLRWWGVVGWIRRWRGLRWIRGRVIASRGLRGRVRSSRAWREFRIQQSIRGDRVRVHVLQHCTVVMLLHLNWNLKLVLYWHVRVLFCQRFIWVESSIRTSNTYLINVLTWRFKKELGLISPTHCFKLASPKIIAGVLSVWSSAKSNPKFSFNADEVGMEDWGANAAAEVTADKTRREVKGAIFIWFDELRTNRIQLKQYLKSISQASKGERKLRFGEQSVAGRSAFLRGRRRHKRMYQSEFRIPFC